MYLQDIKINKLLLHGIKPFEFLSGHHTSKQSKSQKIIKILKL